MESRIKLSADDIKTLQNQLIDSALDIIEKNVADSSASRGLSRRDSVFGANFQGEQNYHLFTLGFEKLINQHFNSMEQSPGDVQQLIEAEELESFQELGKIALDKAKKEVVVDKKPDSINFVGTGGGRQTKRLEYEHHEDAEISKYSAVYMAFLKMPYDCTRIIIEKSRSMVNVGDSAYLRLAKSVGQLNPEKLSANVSLVPNVVFINLVILGCAPDWSSMTCSCSTTPNIEEDINNVMIKYKDRPVQAVVIRIGNVSRYNYFGQWPVDPEFRTISKTLWGSLRRLISQFRETLKTFMLLRNKELWAIDDALESYIPPAIDRCQKLERLYLPNIHRTVEDLKVLERVRVLSVEKRVFYRLPILKNVQKFYCYGEINLYMDEVLGRMPNLQICRLNYFNDAPMYAEITQISVNCLLQNVEMPLRGHDYEVIKTSFPRLVECDICESCPDFTTLTEGMERFLTQTSYIVRRIKFRFQIDLAPTELEQLFGLISTLLRTRGTKRSTIALTFEKGIVKSPRKFFEQLLPLLKSLAKQVPDLENFNLNIITGEKVCECVTTLKLPSTDVHITYDRFIYGKRTSSIRFPDNLEWRRFARS